MRKNIDSYNFGKIVIDGKNYNSDLILFEDRIKSNWWRKSGHMLIPKDIKGILEDKPEILIVGTGAFGYMVVSDETKKILKENNIKLIAQKTNEACKTYNKLSKEKKVVAAFHLTC
jgi:hypothetical protein